MGTVSGAQPAAASRERKQPKAAPASAGRRGGAGSWNKSQEGLPGSSWSGLQRMEAGNGKGEGGRGMRRGFLRPRPRSSCAGGPGTSATLAQHCHADMGGWRLCVASGVTCGWHRERGSGWSPTPARAGAAQVWGSWSLMEVQPDLRCPCCVPALHAGVRGRVLPFLGCRLYPVPPSQQHRQPHGPSAAWRGRALCGPCGAGAAGGFDVLGCRATPAQRKAAAPRLPPRPG